MKLFSSRMGNVIGSFFVALILVGCAGAPQVKSFTLNPINVEKGSPEKSFWRDQVTYPFGVQYAKAKDSKGIEWELSIWMSIMALIPIRRFSCSSPAKELLVGISAM